ncbi:hypothetical protein [Phytohabitans rumicis]|nr:hypothetical protein [Phytohabitans rumicis]
MRTSRKPRIGPREAERLLDAAPSGSAYPELSYLLAAATAPPRPHELAGLHAAVAAFEEAGRYPDAPARRRSRLLRPLGVKLAAGVAVLLVGGTALAAETGNLPTNPFTSGGAPPPATSAPRVDRSTTAPAPDPSPTNHGRTLAPTSPAVLGLCRAWEAIQKNPKAKPMAAEAFRDLAAAAGGADHIGAFCAPLLAQKPERTTGGGKDHPKPSPTPHRKG